VSAFRTLGLGTPEEFYDTFITGGFPLRKGEAGTLGELSPKPHPWLYAEAMRVGIGIPFDQRHTVVGIDDSGAGVCSVRLAGIPTIGIAGGNIIESGTKSLCHHYCENFADVYKMVR
jgi:beta-phosphoglucomutase-like phosphatase (HAD superfamily)